MTWKTRMKSRSAASLLMTLLLAVVLVRTIPAAEIDGMAVILKLKGGVELQARSTESWIVARQGQVLASGDRLRTGGDGEAAVLFVDDKSLLKITAETEILFRAEREDHAVGKRLWMEAGGLWAKVTRSDSQDFRVETPTSVASVKGSEFYSIEQPGLGNHFYALTGYYQYGNELGEIELGPDMTGRSDGQAPPSSHATESGELPGFGGVDGYGVEEDAESRTIRIEFENEEGERKTLVIPLESP